MKKSTKHTIISIFTIMAFFVAIGFTCFSIPETIAGLSDSTLAYVDSQSANSQSATIADDTTSTTTISDSTIAVADPSNSDLTYTAPLGVSLESAPNYTNVYLIITTVEFSILAILLLLSPIFVRVLLAKKSAKNA